MGIQSTIGLGGLFESLEKRFLLHHKKRGKGQIEVKLCNTCFKRENKNKQKKIQKKIHRDWTHIDIMLLCTKLDLVKNVYFGILKV